MCLFGSGVLVLPTAERCGSGFETALLNQTVLQSILKIAFSIQNGRKSLILKILR